MRWDEHDLENDAHSFEREQQERSAIQERFQELPKLYEHLDDGEVRQTLWLMEQEANRLRRELDEARGIVR